MEPQRLLDLLRTLIGLIDAGLDSQSLLEQMAHSIGEHLGVSACFLMAGENSSTTAIEGFWHEENRILPLTRSPLLLANKEVVPSTSQVICLEEIYGLDLDWWQSVASLQCSWAIGITFRGIRNGIAIIGRIDLSQVTGDEREVLGGLSKVIGIAYATLPNVPDVLPIPHAEAIANVSSPVFRERTDQANPLVRRLYELMSQQWEQQRQLLEQQRQLNEMKDDIIAAISDKVRNPLTTMKMAIDALSNTQRNLPQTSQSHFWQILKDEWSKLNQLINNIVTLKQLESRELSFRPQLVNLEVLIREATLPFQEQWREDRRRSLKLKIENSLTAAQTFLETDPQHLQVILQELLSNAGNFSTANTTVGIEVHEVDGEWISIAVTNTGLWIAPEERESIFEPFRRGQGITDRAIAGTGIGLALVKGLLELLYGRIEVESKPIVDSSDYVTVFTVILPRSIAKGRASQVL
jgi:signal transduction histidine kinase